MIRIAQTKNGTVKGIASADPRVTAFKGIPFAAPPVGNLRWAAPQPAADWEGIRQCYEFAPISVQDRPGVGTDIYCREWHVDPDIPMDEDCLYLNVWTGANSTDEKLPVLVWFFGGAFQWGYTAEMEFDGEHIARRGVVVVTVNYRLGALGFLAHPELTKEAPDAPSNFGSLDQQAGLKWVRENIAAFGGNPDNITIAGQSAGGASTLSQLTCEDNYGDIKNAVIMSGLIRNPFFEDLLIVPQKLTTVEKWGEEFFEFLGVKTLAEARKLDAMYIRDKYAEFAANHPRFAICIDGKFVKEDPYQRFLDGKYADANVMCGNTVDEFFGKVPEDYHDKQFTGREFSVIEPAIKAVFNRNSSKPSKKNLYYYRFMPDIPGEDNPGCFHSVDLWFFFDNVSKCTRPYKGRHFELAEYMCNYFTNFIKTGDPNGVDRGGYAMPYWENYTIDNKVEMNFTKDGPVTGLDKSELIASIADHIGYKKQGYNPYLPSWEYIPDGEPYVFDGRVYVYGSHDTFAGATFCLGDYVCWSAPIDDLASWRYEGVIYKATDDPLNPDRRMCLYAPDVTIGPDGRYYLYYVLDKVSIVSVAVCDTPAGKYKYLGNVKYPDGTLYGNKEGDEPQFDPGVLTEGDYTHLYTGFCGQGDKSRHGSMYVKLDKDMLTIVDGPRFIAPGKQYSDNTDFVNHAFFEAPSIRKHGDTYYFVYSSEVMHELCYATSKYPDRDFKYGGVIVSNTDIGIDTYKDIDTPAAYGANNHGSIVEINGDWYIFYHRHTNGNWYCRQGCVEKISFNPDGSIPQVEMTSCGSNNGPLNDTSEYPAYIVCNMFSDKKETYVGAAQPMVSQMGADGDKCKAYITNISEGYTFGFKYFDCHDVKGMYILSQGYGDGYFEVRTNPTGKVLGTIKVEFTNVFTRFESNFTVPDGVNAIYLTYQKGGNIRLQSFGFIH